MHSALVLLDKSCFCLIFTFLRMKLFLTFWSIYSANSKDFLKAMAPWMSQKLSLQTMLNWFHFPTTENVADNCQAQFRPLCNKILLWIWQHCPPISKLFWPFVRQNCSSDWERLLKFEAEGREFAKFVEITRTIYSNFERHQKFLKQNVFLHR